MRTVRTNIVSDVVERLDRLIVNISEKVTVYLSEELGHAEKEIIEPVPAIPSVVSEFTEDGETEESFSVEKLVEVVEPVEKVEPAVEETDGNAVAGPDVAGPS